MSLPGPSATSLDVCRLVAVGGEADIERTLPKDLYSGRIKALATGRTYGSIGDGGLAFPTLVQTVTGLGAGREPRVGALNT
jgi:hypothetical protein